MTIQEALKLGMDRYNAGQLAEAASIYQQILAAHPNQPDALHLLGMTARQAGQKERAVGLIRRAIAVSPARPDFHGNLGFVLMEMGRPAEAVAAYRRVIELNPQLALAHNNLGNALKALGKTDEAIESFLRAKAAPRYSDPAYNLGNLYKDLGRLDEAIAEYELALAIRPAWADALNNLGVVYKAKERPDLAGECFKKAIAAAPDFATAWNNLADALNEETRFIEAVAACRRALELSPNLPEANNNMGLALSGLGEYDAAIPCFGAALSARPEFAEAHNNLAGAFHQKGELEQAMSGFRTAVAIKPDYFTARWNMGLIHLMRGEYEQGWKEYEWRLKLPRRRTRRHEQPRWDGGELHGRRILVETDQALGDTFQFFRYVPMLAERGARVVVACQSELVELLRIQECVEACVDAGSEKLPEYDVHIPMPSLPMMFQTTVETIPRSVPYIKADERRAAGWETRVAEAAGSRWRVGLVWAGRSYPDPFRATTLAELAVLGGVAGNWFCSLQKGAPPGVKPPAELELTDWTEELVDFTDTAALMSRLDLIISIDTATAHLAGAMGKPVWVLLKTVPDWRWMLGRDDCAWYPTARLFRQEKFRDWSAPIRRVAGALSDRQSGHDH